MTTLNLSSAAAETLDVGALVVAVSKGEDGPLLVAGAEAVDEALAGRLLESLAALGATGKEGEVTRLATLGATSAPVVVAVGLGSSPSDGQPYEGETLRKAMGCAVRALAGTSSVAVAVSASGSADLRALAEGALLGAYSFRRYREASADDHRPPVLDVTLLVPDTGDDEAKAVARRAQAVARAVGLARDLVNTPASDLHPDDLAEVARTECTALGVEVEVLDETALAEGGYGGIIGVGQGSAHPPRLVRLAYRHPDATTTVALVGKGITFDSGGLSLKPPTAMDWMKVDMGGAAAVLAAVTAVAATSLPVNVTGWIPTAENMPSGTAIRPSDVLTMYSGTRVEVNNTDAEGRLVLADAISRACEESPDYLVDVATLTGAALVALGTRTTGVMSNDDHLCEAVVAASNAAGEPTWPMPLPDHLRKSIDSDIADLVNTGDKFGGMLVAGLFLREFVPEGTRWAHLDIAGPAWNAGDAYGYTPKGGTGAAVRTFVQLVEDLAGAGSTATPSSGA